MTYQGGGSLDGRLPPDQPPEPGWRAVAFIIAMLGVVLVAVTPNPPEQPIHWVQVIGGAALTSFLTTFAGWQQITRLKLRGHGTRLVQWLARRRVATVIALALTATLVFAVPPVVDFGRGLVYDIWGCGQPTQLRMIASPEAITTARELADAYERWTAERNHDCPTVEFFVYAGPVAEVGERVPDQPGWLDEPSALREIGPEPDLLLAVTSHEITDLEASVAETTTIAYTPVVLGLPPQHAAQQGDMRRRWPDLFTRLANNGVPIVRGDPSSGELGMLATALLYGLGDEHGAESEGRRRVTPPEIERYIASSLDRGGFPLTDTSTVLCRLRQDNPSTAVVATEQQIARFNTGQSLGTSCPAPRAESARRLVAVYPTDTRVLDYQLVRFAWSSPPQREAADAFAAWLTTEPGRKAIIDSRLRPASGAIPVDFGPVSGTSPSVVVVPEPVPNPQWTAAATQYELAQRRARVILALDTSGSMGATTPEGTRWSITAAAVSSIINGIGPRDELGLWFFPDGSGTGHIEALRLGTLDAQRMREVHHHLIGVRPAGNTPLLRTIVDAAAALGRRGDDTAEVNAVVVVTDGEDTSSDIGPQTVVDQLTARGIRLIVVTLGEVSCASGELGIVTAATGGECRDAELSTLNTVLSAATMGLWGGR